MKKNIKKKLLITSLLGIMVIPTVTFALSVKQHFGSYSVAHDKHQYIEYSETDSAYKYQNSNLTVSSFLADSGGDGSYCSWCTIEVTLKHKGLLGIYTNKKQNVVKVPKVGYYEVQNYGDVGTGTFRLDIGYPNHEKSSGTIRANVQNGK